MNWACRFPFARNFLDVLIYRKSERTRSHKGNGPFIKAVRSFLTISVELSYLFPNAVDRKWHVLPRACAENATISILNEILEQFILTTENTSATIIAQCPHTYGPSTKPHKPTSGILGPTRSSLQIYRTNEWKCKPTNLFGR